MKYFNPPAQVVDKYELIRFKRRMKERKNTKSNGFTMTPDIKAPLTIEEAIPMLRK